MALQLTPGTHIAHYSLEECLGSGASGEVWLANDGTQPVAVKFTNPNLLIGSQAEKHRKRLINEIRALEILVGSPNIPRLYGYDMHFERPYLVMQYVGASPLDQMISSGLMMQIKLMKRLSMLQTIAATINQMHQSGVIHRDIKPHNINGVDHPYLLDFSIATEKKYAHLAETHIGTAIYMAPIDGNAPDELADNYSFAVVAYEVLFGKHPIFTVDNIGKTITETCNLAREHIEKRTWHCPTQIPPDDLPVNLRGADLVFLDEIFQRGMGSRQQRYTDLNEFVEDLKLGLTVKENEPYLDLVDEIRQTTGIPREAGYTAQEVESAARKTQHQPEKRRGRWKFWKSKQA